MKKKGTRVLKSRRHLKEDLVIIENLGAIKRGFKKVGGAIKGGLQKAGSAIVNTATTVGNFAKKTIDKALSALDITKLIQQIIDKVKNPIIDTFKRVFNMDFILSHLNAIGNKIRATFEQPIMNVINKLKSQLMTLFTTIKGTINGMLSAINNLLSNIMKSIKNLHKLMANLFETLKNKLLQAFSSFGRMISTLVNTVVRKVVTESKKVINVLNVQISKIAELSKMLLSAGSKFINKYVKGPVLSFFDGFIKVMIGLYEFIKDKVINDPSDTSFFNCLGTMLNQTDDILWNISPSLVKFYLKNQELNKPQCKSQFLIDMYNGRLFIQNNKISSAITIIIGYVVLQQIIKYLSSDTKELIPNYVLVLFTVLAYAQYVSSNEKNRQIIIDFYSKAGSLIPDKLKLLYKKNYTAFSIFMILMVYEIKLIGQMLIPVISEKIESGFNKITNRIWI
jgi:archaellum component FlaC